MPFTIYIFIHGDGGAYLLPKIQTRALALLPLNFCHFMPIRLFKWCRLLVVLTSIIIIVVFACWPSHYEYNRKRNKFGTTNVVHLRALHHNESWKSCLVAYCKFRMKMTETIILQWVVSRSVLRIALSSRNKNYQHMSGQAANRTGGDSQNVPLKLWTIIQETLLRRIKKSKKMRCN